MPVCWRLQGWFLRQGLDFGANFVLYRGHPADVSMHCPLAAPSTIAHFRTTHFSTNPLHKAVAPPLSLPAQCAAYDVKAKGCTCVRSHAGTIG